jgi:hypothetical protein
VTNDHNPRTPRQLPPEMRLTGARRRQPLHGAALPRLTMLAMAAMAAAGWIAAHGLPLGR